MHVENSSILKGKESGSTHHSKDFYNSSVLKPNSLSEICNEITSTETFDHNVERVNSTFKFYQAASRND